jgi:nucleoside 2-deoxyribosyltransferase
MDKRYQVFVSSTFVDLQEERQEVMQALLELDCIPAGMELFPAGNQDQWTLIKRVIDDCDYYIVIVGGRYGSQGPEGLSYTEMEYRYAIERGKPVMAFLHKKPDDIAAKKTETSVEAREKLNAFRTLVEQKVCRYWSTPADLGAQVSRSLIRLIKDFPAVGWVKADAGPSRDSSREILRLRERIDDLERELAESRMRPPEGSQDLAQGQDPFRFTFSVLKSTDEGSVRESSGFSTTWNEIFHVLGPFMLGDASDAQLASAFTEYVKRRYIAYRHEVPEDLALEANTINLIKIQLRALGLITRSTKPKSIKDTATYWTLTPYGDSQLTTLGAVRRRPLPTLSEAPASIDLEAP